jgi:hypothetical protein
MTAITSAVAGIIARHGISAAGGAAMAAGAAGTDPVVVITGAIVAIAGMVISYLEKRDRLIHGEVKE